MFDEFSAGHLFMVGIPGTELDDSTLFLIREDGIHNFIIFRRNVENKKQLKGLCADLCAACLDAGLPRPLISIDQEGGQVARLAPPFTQFPEPRQLVEDLNSEELLSRYAKVCADELLEVGINMNLAPVLDICPSKQGLFMERRCLGDTPQEVAELGQLVIEGMQEGGLAACAKHFPGLGSAALDPHLELPVVDLPLVHFERDELLPFRVAKEAGVAAVMTSHALYSNLDSDLPGTLSRKVVFELLREECGYQGLIITDDMEMGAIEKFMDFPGASLQALKAGADLLLICHDHNKVRVALAAIKEALATGVIKRAEVSASLRRQQEVLTRFGCSESMALCASA